MSLSERQFGKLTRAIDWSQKQLEIHRAKRVSALKSYVGYHYSEEGSAVKIPVNMLRMALSIYTRALAARTPRALISARNSQLRSKAADLEIAVNMIPDEIKLGRTLRELVMEAMFSIGVVKVGLATAGRVYGIDYGKPFVDVVSIDDFFVDMSARKWEQAQFLGNDYWLTEDQIKDSDWFDRQAKSAVQEAEESEAPMGEHGESRAESLSISGTMETYKKRVWLRDAWLPYEGQFITYTVRGKKLVKSINWRGPEHGPYYVLGYDDVPGNLMPLPSVALWRDLHELSNTLFRKLGRQADAQKTALGFSDEESAISFKGASDGEGIRYSGARPEKLEAGGVDARTLAFFLQCKELHTYFAGNLDALGGLAPQAETLGQDKLLTESAGAQLRDMQSRTIEAVREIFRALAWYEWHDPILSRTLKKSAPGMSSLSVDVEWNPDARMASFSEFDLDIDPYSMLDDSPGLKLQRLGLIMQQYILPLMPMIQQQGGQVDVQAILDMVAKYADFEELEKLVVFPQLGEQQSQRGAPQTGGNQTKTIERVSRPGATPQGKSDVLQRILLGDRPQSAEANILG